MTAGVNTKLKMLASMANVLAGDSFNDGTSTSQKRALRAVADNLRQKLTDVGIEVTVDSVYLLTLGVNLQAQFAELGGNDVLNTAVSLLRGATGKRAGDPDLRVVIVLAYLAQDVLEGVTTGGE